MAVHPEVALRRMREAREPIDEIFRALKPEALLERPIPERHRLIFYLGHVEAFDWNLLARGLMGVPAFDERLDRLFAFGIDPVDGELPDEPASAWPPADEVRAYGARTRAGVDRCLERGAGSPPGSEGERVLHIAIEHRLMHAETLAYLVHQLPARCKTPPAQAPAVSGRGHEPTRVPVPAGRATLGRPHASAGFGWDNEYGELSVEVPAFAIGSHKVPNGAFLEFIRAGGYDEKRFWTEEDWSWRTQRGIAHPAFWVRCGDEWHLRGMWSEFPLPLDWPVWVSHAEAAAYARWQGARLPAEAEFHRAAYGTRSGAERAYPWGAAPPEGARGNFDFQRWDPAPFDAYPEGASAFGVHDLVGNGWEWTATAFSPFPGFAPHPLYRGYSADFFDRKHFVMKGGSPRTAACMLRRTFRNWFQPRLQYPFAGFRLVWP